MPKSKSTFAGSWFRLPKGRKSSGFNIKSGPSRRGKITAISAFVVAFASFGTLALFYSHADTNIVVNGGFNNGSQGWNIYPNTGTNFAVYTSGQGGTNPYEGNGYGATNTAGAGGGIYQDISVHVNSGDVYCASAVVATEGAGGGAGGTMALWMLNGSGNENSNVSFTNLPGNSAWTTEKTCKTATGAHTAIRIQFYPTVNTPTLVMDAVSVSASSATPAATDRLNAGANLTPGQQITSPSGVYRVVLQGDGNLVLYNTAGSALWNTKTNGKGSTQAVMQGDGNLVVYAGSKALWASNTNGKGGTYAVLQNDGNFVIYTAANKAVWASNTAQASTAAPAPVASTCTSGHWYTTGNGGGTTYFTCSSGKWVSATCPAGTVAVSSSSSSGPCLPTTNPKQNATVSASCTISAPAHTTNLSSANVMLTIHNSGTVAFVPSMTIGYGIGDDQGHGRGGASPGVTWPSIAAGASATNDIAQHLNWGSGDTHADYSVTSTSPAFSCSATIRNS